MGTLGCINDMLQRDKENRELRKRNRERLSETRNRLIDIKNSTDYSNMTLEKMEEIKLKTMEKEKLDKTSSLKLLLYYAAGIILTAFFILLILHIKNHK